MWTKVEPGPKWASARQSLELFKRTLTSRFAHPDDRIQRTLFTHASTMSGDEFATCCANPVVNGIDIPAHSLRPPGQHAAYEKVGRPNVDELKIRDSLIGSTMLSELFVLLNVSEAF